MRGWYLLGKQELKVQLMQMNPKKAMFAVCLGAALAFTGLTGCQTHGDRTAGRYMDDRSVSHRVNTALADDPVFKYPDVKVMTYDGIVQLSGFVDTADQKNRASVVAQHTDGVRQVVNSLVLKPQVPQTAASVINNENRITPTGSATGHRLDATTANQNLNSPSTNYPVNQQQTPPPNQR
jgi:hyperosmotically inducible protein